MLTVRPDAPSDGICPNCRASLSASEAVVAFESDASDADGVTLVECPSCGSVVRPASPGPADDGIRVFRGRSAYALCATCGAPVTLVVPERSVVTDRHPDGVVNARCERCAGVTTVGFKRRGE
ncbi:hypothetical protein NDI76_18315 [Halogeometricum sp. S1BR25-6]|uniref:DUF7837 domain-containing protein n=1 Tax=Halogeometricum salsisoli TaxID=2950536 RepID=A0ABU2GIQ0_9EURY|nr:hypothetical protein [Halogeometricum sp. S1BR25-6]MDS0300706.1 hypothetical protein [Halogeometricum sp. S1BR25-6]